MTETHFDNTPIFQTVLERHDLEEWPLSPLRTHEEFMQDTGYREWLAEAVGDAPEDAEPITPGEKT